MLFVKMNRSSFYGLEFLYAHSETTICYVPYNSLRSMSCGLFPVIQTFELGYAHEVSVCQAVE